MDAWLWFTAHFLLFAVVHSVLATQAVKQQIFSILPGLTRFYRLLYNGIALFWTLFLWKQIPHGTAVLWAIPWPWTLISALLMLFAAIGAAQSVAQLNAREFLGIAQLFKPAIEPELDAATHKTLSTRGWYGRVRHPLYFFSMLFLCAKPTMTVAHAAVCVFCGIYFFIGSRREEKMLEATFGESFRMWKRNVPLFFPRWKHYNLPE
jgi:protein-S-isoprenylcysteine O-methyltransferase Ste14